METRPRIKLKLANSDIIVEILCFTLIITLWVLTILNYKDLPEIIPIHYNAKGEADGFGEKSTIFTLPLVATILFIALTILNKYPHIFNYATTITNENALKQYTIATKMIRFLKLVICIIFCSIAFMAIRNADSDEGLGNWFLPSTIALIFIPLTYFFIKSVND